MKAGDKIFLPGATIGVLGSGQLGRMFALAAHKLGYHVHVYSPDQNTPAGQVAAKEFTGAYEDLAALRKFADTIDVLTFEFENVPSASADAAAAVVPVRPRGEVLHIAQNRRREKEFLSKRSYPVAPFRVVRTDQELKTAVDEIGMPCVLKTAGFGYDGKGQRLIRTSSDLIGAVAPAKEYVLEGFIDYEHEFSVIVARGLRGEVAHWGTIRNIHRNHILDFSLSPSGLRPEVCTEAEAMATKLASDLNVVGLLCVEFFLTRDNRILINEIAPRPHNSGHLTFDGSVTSQFEQHVRAVCGLPLGNTQMLSPIVMANLLGELWKSHEPRWESALKFSDVKLHLYGKATPSPGRKMGHLNAFGASVEMALDTAQKARESLTK